MAKKKTYLDIKRHVEGKGLTLISKEYVGSSSKLEVSCPKGHRKLITWKTLRRTKDPCVECVKEQTIINIQRRSKEYEIAKEIKVKLKYKKVSDMFADEGYTLLSTSLTSDKNKLKLQCPQGHVMQQRLSNFYRGNRCFECFGSPKTTLQEVSDYVQGYGYCLLSDKYIGTNEYILLSCPRGHSYRVTFSKFKSRGDRCSTCSGKGAGLSLEIAREEFNSVGYTLTSKTYETALHNLNFVCSKGHRHKMTLSNLKAGQRCGKCFVEFEFGRSSRPERELAQRYLKLEPTAVVGDRKIISPYELDIYFPEQKVAVEYCGLYWHSDKFKSRDYHYKKMKLCEEKGVRLITIFEDEYLNRPDVVVSRIDSALNLTPNKVYARKCTLVCLSNKEAKDFLDKYHLQGASTCKVSYGLLYKGDLLSVMTLGAITRAHAAGNIKMLELKRLATVPGHIVVGGASRLFKCSLKYAVSNGYEEVRSYCDKRWSSLAPTVYETLGFSKLRESKYTPHYYKGQKRYRNFSLRKTPEERLTGKTEWELRKDQGYSRVWDCGHTTYIYSINQGS